MCGACGWGERPAVRCQDATPHQAEVEHEDGPYDADGRL